MKMPRWTPTLLSGCLLLSVTACATMGPAPPRLSAELGDRMAEMQGLHQLALESFFDSERKLIEEFLEREWIPLFLKNFMGTSDLMNDLATGGLITEQDRANLHAAVQEYLIDPAEADDLTDRIVSAVSGSRTQEATTVRGILADFVEDDRLEAATSHVSSLLRTADPALLLIEWVTDAQEQINLQRQQMLAPLDEAERVASADLAAAYADMLKANGVITARLEAAAKKTEAQDQLLATFGVKDVANDMRMRLANISQAVGAAVSAAGAAVQEGQEATRAASTLIESLRTALSSMNN